MMSNFDPLFLQKSLKDRGVNLNQGKEKFPEDDKVDQLYIKVHSVFDGFSEWDLDGESCLTVFSFAQIYDDREAASLGKSRRVFADFLMGSDQYTLDLWDSAAPIISVSEQNVIAENYAAFWDNLLNGKFDFL